MQEDANDITDLNYMGLVVPKDGEVAVVADGCSTWAPVPDLDPLGRDDGEHWLPMLYEPVLSADSKTLDVVAWCEDDPSRWWRRTGKGVVLGAAELERVSWTNLPCLLVSTPAGWRWYEAQQKAAICILDLDGADLANVFGTVFGTVFCASEELARRFRERARSCGEDFHIVVDDLL